MKVTGPKYKTIIMLRYKSSINYKVSTHYGVPQAHFMSLKKESYRNSKSFRRNISFSYVL